MNDRDRTDFIDNDEGLYRMQRSSGLSKREFIRQNRGFIDEVIDNVVNGREQAHYLVYGSRQR